MDKAYNHTTEEELYKLWEKNGAFSPNDSTKPFTIIMPPPNANDPLHVGHAMFIAIEDILVRYHRMKGEAVEWLPGTDHAGIETQFVYEKKLAKENKSRFDFDRETLYQRIWEYVEMNSSVALSQMKRLGASADWERYKFTLDPAVVSFVCETFKKLHQDNLVYRAEKLVNYCPHCGTAYSELEVDHEERTDKLYMIEYPLTDVTGAVTVATTRPETLFGDVAVAVNPNDSRYKALIGKKVKLPLTNREIEIIADEGVDVAFGTGAVKITPAHDPFDWSVIEKNKDKFDLLKTVNEHTVIGINGKMTTNAGTDYENLSVFKAREKVIKELDHEKNAHQQTQKKNIS
jgi:valyl-tRNA synthetase